MKFTLKYYLAQKFKGYSEYLFVYLFAYGFFLLSLSENFSAAHDSITYLNDVTGKENLFHPHHLLYNALAAVWLDFWKLIFNDTPAYFIIEAFTAVWGAGIILISWCFFRNRFNMAVTPAIIAVAVIAFSYGVWFYSANIEVYAPSVFFMLWLLYELCNKKQPDSYGNLSVIHCLAILFHQVNIIFSLILLFQFRKNKKFLINYILSGLVIVGGVYFYAGWYAEGHNNISDFSTWLLGYTYGHDYWAPWNSRTLPAMLTGFGHSFIGGQFIFNTGFLGDILKENFSSHNFNDEIFLVKKLSTNTASLLLVLSMLAGLLMAVFTILMLKNKPWKNSEKRKIFQILFAAFWLYTVFFSFWEPEILEFWILQSVIFWIVILGFSADFLSKKNFALLSIPLALSLFIVNYTGSIKWLKDKENDLYYIKIKELEKIVQPEDVFVLEKTWILDEYISGFLGNMVYSSSDFEITGLKEQKGRIIYLPDTNNPIHELKGNFQPASGKVLQLTTGGTVIIYEFSMK